jgi:hypothetical protein
MSVTRIGLVSGCLVLSGLGGCATPGELSRQPPELQAPTPPTEGDSRSRAVAPVVVRIEKKREVAPGEVELEVVIDRRTSDPVSLAVELPPGAELVEGSTHETLDEPGRRLVRTLRLRLPNGTPLDDVRVSADARGRGYGVRATSAYRFGRPAPKLAQPERSSTASIANGKALGKPIPIR